MEADWEFQVGGDAPVIVARWEGFVDLRTAPAKAPMLAECSGLPGLASALQTLNARESPVWTSKCDVWPIAETEAIDPDELAAEPGNLASVFGCYIDLLPKAPGEWSQAASVEGVCRAICARLNKMPIPCCRADLVVRRAFIELDAPRMGITAYVTAGGDGAEAARSALQIALGALAEAVCSESTVQ